MKKTKDDISRSEVSKYQDTMMADMGITSLDELSKEERSKWKKLLRPNKNVKKKLKDLGYSLYTNKNKRSLGSKLFFLREFLLKNNLKKEALSISRIIKRSAIPGITTPTEDIDVDGVNNAIAYMLENPGLPLYLDFPAGTKKWLINEERVSAPFHYGEVVEIVNPADNMGWDVAFSTDELEPSLSSDGIAYVPYGHSLLPAGFVPVASERKIKEKSPKDPPTPGNDKIILSHNGIISDKNKEEMEAFFGKLWNFEDIVWL